MKILERGTPKDSKVFKARCKNCESLLEFKRSEATEFHERNETFLRVNCPVCKGFVYAYPNPPRKL